MTVITLRLIRIAVFFAAYYLFSRALLVYLKKRNPGASMSDPEVIASGVIFAAVITGAFSFLIKILV
ncbi:MAG TPA: hypothetical protein PK358_10290 [Spirochaetota bacterium]|nr:hypothetical protein [Spirochaetota bacterium]HPJ35214.1 hypothetical protein [Spirochaetota bacterium]